MRATNYILALLCLAACVQAAIRADLKANSEKIFLENSQKGIEQLRIYSHKPEANLKKLTYKAHSLTNIREVKGAILYEYLVELESFKGIEYFMNLTVSVNSLNSSDSNVTSRLLNSSFANRHAKSLKPLKTYEAKKFDYTGYTNAVALRLMFEQAFPKAFEKINSSYLYKDWIAGQVIPYDYDVTFLRKDDYRIDYFYDFYFVDSVGSDFNASFSVFTDPRESNVIRELNAKLNHAVIPKLSTKNTTVVFSTNQFVNSYMYNDRLGYQSTYREAISALKNITSNSPTLQSKKELLDRKFFNAERQVLTHLDITNENHKCTWIIESLDQSGHVENHEFTATNHNQGTYWWKLNALNTGIKEIDEAIAEGFRLGYDEKLFNGPF